MILDAYTRDEKYKKVDPDSPMFHKNGEWDDKGHTFKCGTCGLLRHILGEDAWEWEKKKQQIRCKNCNWTMEYRNKMPARQAIHYSNIKRR